MIDVGYGLLKAVISIDFSDLRDTLLEELLNTLDVLVGIGQTQDALSGENKFLSEDPYDNNPGLFVCKLLETFL